MRDDAKPVDSSIAFDPANPNNGAALKWDASPGDYYRAKQVAQRIAHLVNAAKRDPKFLDPQIVQADLICLHCNGRPQDFAVWEMMEPVDAAAEYSSIYYNMDRPAGKLPDFVKLRTDKK